MPQHWVFAITEDNLELCLQHGIIGARGRTASRLEHFEPGDLIIFYVSKKTYSGNKPVGEFRVIAKCRSHAFESYDIIWPGAADVDTATLANGICRQTLMLTDNIP